MIYYFETSYDFHVISITRGLVPTWGLAHTLCFLCLRNQNGWYGFTCNCCRPHPCEGSLASQSHNCHIHSPKHCFHSFMVLLMHDHEEKQSDLYIMEILATRSLRSHGISYACLHIWDIWFMMHWHQHGIHMLKEKYIQVDTCHIIPQGKLCRNISEITGCVHSL